MYGRRRSNILAFLYEKIQKKQQHLPTVVSMLPFAWWPAGVREPRMELVGVDRWAGAKDTKAVPATTAAAAAVLDIWGAIFLGRLF